MAPRQTSQSAAPEPFWKALLPPAVGAVSSLLTNVWGVREARANRRFQERMSSTAHQREVADLRKAGLNPILSANRGASTPGGSTAQIQDVGRGVQSALAVKRFGAEIDLLRAQTDRERASAELSREQTTELGGTRGTRMGLVEAQTQVQKANAAQLRTMLPELVQKARAEVEQLGSSARAQKARAVLDELAEPGAKNWAAISETIGELGPWARVALGAAERLYRYFTPGGRR